MKVSYFIRQFHRWMSIIFTFLVLVAFVASTRPAPPEWLFYAPLPALMLMLLGHVDKWRIQRRIDVMSMKPRKLSAVLS